MDKFERLPKLQALLIEKERLEERKKHLDSFLISIRVKDRPSLKQIGFFKDRYTLLSRPDTSLFYEWLMEEKVKCSDRIYEIETELIAAEKAL